MKRFFNVLLKLLLAVVALFIVWFVGSVWWPLEQLKAPTSFATSLIKNVKIVDVERGLIIPEQDIVIKQGVFVEIGKDLDVDAEHVVDGGGRYVIPGLFDMHIHSFKMSPYLTHPLFVAAGVTAVRDLGGCIGQFDGWVACVDDKRAWTDLVVAGQMVGPKYDHISSMAIDGGNEIPDGASRDLGAGTAEGARKRVAFDHSRGIDFLKTYTMLPREGYFKLATEAEKVGMYIAGHLPYQVSALEAIEAGQKSFEHALLFIWECYPNIAEIRASDDPFENYDNDLRLRMVREHDATTCKALFKAMADEGVAFTPTHTTRKLDALSLNEEYKNDARLKFIPAPLRTMWLQDAAGMAKRAGDGGIGSYEAIYKFGLELTAAAHQAGVRVMVGTDSPDSYAFPGFGVHDELSHLVQAGLSNIDALRAATIEPAKFLGLEGVAGTIAVGSRADFVLLNHNPIESIEAVRDIEGVSNSGVYYDRVKLNELLSMVESNANSLSMGPKFIWQIYNSPLMLKQFAD